MTLKVGSVLSSCKMYVMVGVLVLGCFFFFLFVFVSFVFYLFFLSFSEKKKEIHLLYNLKENIVQAGSDVILLPKGTDSGALQVTCLLLTLLNLF